MSMTFSLPYGTFPEPVYNIVCSCGTVTHGRHPGPWHEAEAEAERCDIESPCPEGGLAYAAAVHPEGYVDLNVSNVNGLTLLVALGFVADYSGTVSPEDLGAALESTSDPYVDRYREPLTALVVAARGMRTNVDWS